MARSFNNSKDKFKHERTKESAQDYGRGGHKRKRNLRSCPEPKQKISIYNFDRQRDD